MIEIVQANKSTDPYNRTAAGKNQINDFLSPFWPYLPALVASETARPTLMAKVALTRVKMERQSTTTWSKPPPAVTRASAGFKNVAKGVLR